MCKECYTLYHVKRKYGLSEEEYKALGSTCNLCGKSFKNELKFQTWKKVLCVDHDHKTNKVRGLLCNGCNRGLGMFNDNSELLRKAADYLDERA